MYDTEGFALVARGAVRKLRRGSVGAMVEQSENQQKTLPYSLRPTPNSQLYHPSSRQSMKERARNGASVVFDGAFG